MLSLTALPWILLQNFVNTVTYVRRSPWISSADQPDAIKRYSSKGNLFASRIFKPASTTTPALPLLIRIHGGGFIMNSPAADDTLARFLADNVPCVVISMDHSKAPRHVFPEAYEDLIEQSLAAIQDSELNVDASKVVISGSSSGGNLALAIAQDQRLRSKVLGVMALTPIVDFVTPFKEKMASRPDPSVPDFLASLYETLMPLYVANVDVSLDDVRISPSHFTSRGDLSKHVYLIGAEHDLLSKEAELMAEKLAQGQTKHETERGWWAHGIRWDRIKGQRHGFENFPVKDQQLEQVRLREAQEVFECMAEWLRKVFDGFVEM